MLVAGSLQESLFLAIGLLGSRVRSGGSRLIGGRVFFVAGDCPPAILELRQLAHLSAMFRAGLVRAMTITERRSRPRPQRRGLIGESSSRNSSQQDGRANRLAEPAGSRFHLFILK
jgi:hypothetical protein